MSTPRKTGSASSDESGAAASDLPHVEMPGAGTKHKKASITGRGKTRALDYDDAAVLPRWKKIIDRRREALTIDVLQIARPRGKIDAIAKAALDILVPTLLKSPADASSQAGGYRTTTPDALEKQVRAFIVEKGIASEVKKVTQRLNARRMTDGRRWTLSVAYVYLLLKLFEDKANNIEEVIADDLGVAEKIMLDLEAEHGPLDKFALLIVKAVMERNRIGESPMLQELVSQQVRAAI